MSDGVPTIRRRFKRSTRIRGDLARVSERQDFRSGNIYMYLYIYSYMYIKENGVEGTREEQRKKGRKGWRGRWENCEGGLERSEGRFGTQWEREERREEKGKRERSRRNRSKSNADRATVNFAVPVHPSFPIDCARIVVPQDGGGLPRAKEYSPIFLSSRSRRRASDRHHPLLASDATPSPSFRLSFFLVFAIHGYGAVRSTKMPLWPLFVALRTLPVTGIGRLLVYQEWRLGTQMLLALSSNVNIRRTRVIARSR